MATTKVGVFWAGPCFTGACCCDWAAVKRCSNALEQVQQAHWLNHENVPTGARGVQVRDGETSLAVSNVYRLGTHLPAMPLGSSFRVHSDT